jgi:Spy/CpxP family protein refolding chaperone
MTIRTPLMLLTLAALVGPMNLSAQNPGPDPAQAPQLRRELEQRFAARLKEELALTDEQDQKVRAVMGSYADRRRALEGQERALRQALTQQLRPGVAANSDSVGKLVDAISAGRTSYAQLVQAEMKELATVLTPIQRGQLFLLRDRLLQRAMELRQQRGGAGRPFGPPGPP